MAVNQNMLPQLVDPSGFDAILQTGYEPYHAAQLAQWGLPVRPAMGADRRRRQQYADDIMAENQSVNQMLNDLSNRQLDVDTRAQDVDLSKSVISGLDTGNDSAMAALGLVQEQLVDPAYFDEILNSGDSITRSKTLAEGNKAQAEADSEPIRAAAAMKAAEASGAEKGPKIRRNYNSMGDDIGYYIEGPYNGDPNIPQGKPSPTVSIYDEGNNQPVELPSVAGTGRRLIKNSDGSGTVIEPDGTKTPVSAENMKKYGF